MPIVVTIYSEVLPGDAARILAQLNADPAAAVEVRINSPGGSVVEGLAIFNALKPRMPVVYVDGVAASVASLIAMAGARIVAAENSLLMIHDPWAGAEGNATELRRTADLLDKHRDAMLTGYARSGQSRQQLTNLLAAETWMTATEALALGFIDEISAALSYAAHAPACFAGYKHPPKELTMPPNATTTAHNASGAAVPNSNPAQPSAQSTQLGSVSADSVNAVVQSDHTFAAIRARNDEMLAIATPYMAREKIRSYTIEALADPRLSVENFRTKMLALLGADATPCGGRQGSIEGGVFGGSDFVVAAADAMAIRAGIHVQHPHPGARDVQGMSAAELMRVCISRAGRTLDMGASSQKHLVKAAMSTSDFPAILENSFGKSLRSGFEAEPSTFETWTRKVLVRDFKPQSRVLLGSAPELLPVPELGEYQQGSMDEDKSVPYSVSKFGRLVGLSWEALINDDLGAFARVVQALGQAAARAEADAVYNTFAENSGAGPEMQDSINLFHASHSNLAASATDITADALSSARVLLRRQKAIGGGALNLVPRYLLVAPEQEQAAETLLAASVRALSQGANNALTPKWLASLELVVEARLSGDAFYVLADSGSIDTLERAWLEADNGPVIEQEDTFSTDARFYKARHVFASRWLDWRGAVKVPLS